MKTPAILFTAAFLAIVGSHEEFASVALRGAMVLGGDGSLRTGFPAAVRPGAEVLYGSAPDRFRPRCRASDTTAQLGGEIRHTELRRDLPVQTVEWGSTSRAQAVNVDSD